MQNNFNELVLLKLIFCLDFISPELHLARFLVTHSNFETNVCLAFFKINNLEKSLFEKAKICEYQTLKKTKSKNPYQIVINTQNCSFYLSNLRDNLHARIICFEKNDVHKHTMYIFILRSLSAAH